MMGKPTDEELRTEPFCRERKCKHVYEHVRTCCPSEAAEYPFPEPEAYGTLTNEALLETWEGLGADYYRYGQHPIDWSNPRREYHWPTKMEAARRIGLVKEELLRRLGSKKEAPATQTQPKVMEGDYVLAKNIAARIEAYEASGLKPGRVFLSKGDVEKIPEDQWDPLGNRITLDEGSRGIRGVLYGATVEESPLVPLGEIAILPAGFEGKLVNPVACRRI